MSVLGWSPSLVRVSRERDAALAPAEAGSPRWVAFTGGGVPGGFRVDL